MIFPKPFLLLFALLSLETIVVSAECTSEKWKTSPNGGSPDSTDTPSECRKKALAYGFFVGGGGHDFEGVYHTKGCYYYKSGPYANRAYWGGDGDLNQIVKDGQDRFGVDTNPPTDGLCTQECNLSPENCLALEAEGAYCSCVDEGGAAGSHGDPHFKTWSGDKFDFHGGCDLVLLENPAFANGLGLYVHIRTKINHWWSFIQSAVVQIGDHTLEIAGGEKDVSYRFNREQEGHDLKTGVAALGDFQVNFFRITDHQGRARINLHDGDAISIETFNDFVRVNIKPNTRNTKFVGSAGLVGSYPSGKKVGRDGVTLIEEANDFGEEWHVRPGEPMLFHDMLFHDNVQPDIKCSMPEATGKEEIRRRLGESAIMEEDAALACARVIEEDRNACIFDVMATNDKDMAGSY